MWEIDENLRHSELSELERGEHLLKRKALYERLHPETKAGVTQAVGMHQSLGHNVAANLATTSFVTDAAEKTGTSARAVRRSVQRAKKIDSKVRDRIRGNAEIANSGAELDALASLDAQQQKQAVKMVETGKVKTVREARDKISPPAPRDAPAVRVTKEHAQDPSWEDENVRRVDEEVDPETGEVIMSGLCPREAGIDRERRQRRYTLF